MSARGPRALAPYLVPHAATLAAAAACVGGGALATVGLVPLARYAARAFGHLTLPDLDRVVLALVGLYALKGIFAFGQAALGQRVALAVAARLREDAYAHLLELDLRAHAGYRSTDLSSRLVQDVGVVKDALATVVADVVPSGVVLVYSLGYAFWLNWHLAAATLVSAPAVGWAIATFGRRLHAQSVHAQARVADVFARATETLGALPVVRAFGRGDQALERFAADNQQHRAALWQGALIQAAQPAVLALLQTVAIGAVLWVGGYEITRGRLTGPDLIAFAAAIAIGVDPTLVLSQAWGKLQAAAGALSRVLTLFDAPRRQASGQCDALELQGHLVLDGVRFGYDPARPVLHEVTLEVRPGEVVAIAGPSGGGKSTLAALALGLYAPDVGRVTLDGHDLGELSERALRGAVAYVPQEPTLFAGSVSENVALGRPGASRDAIEAACRAAHAHEFILALPGGYDADVGERGNALSGGQRQRLAIARALLADPRLLVLDEATAALDHESVAAVQAGLESLMAGRATLVIAHRWEAIARADRVYVLEGGRVVESGTPKTLMGTDGAFRRLAEAATSTPA